MNTLHNCKEEVLPPFPENEAVDEIELPFRGRASQWSFGRGKIET